MPREVMKDGRMLLGAIWIIEISLLNVKSLFSVSNIGRNRKQQHEKVRTYTIPAKQRIKNISFSTTNFGNLLIAE